MLSCFSHVLLFEIPWTVARQTPLSIGFPRQGYWSGLSFLSSGQLPWPRDWIQGLNLLRILAGGFFTSPAIADIEKDSFGYQISRKCTNAASDFHSPILYLTMAKIKGTNTQCVPSNAYSGCLINTVGGDHYCWHQCKCMIFSKSLLCETVHFSFYPFYYNFLA